MAKNPVGHGGNWAGWAWEHPNTLLQQSQGKGEVKANPEGDVGGRRGDSPQQDGGRGQGGGLNQVGTYCWLENHLGRTMEIGVICSPRAWRTHLPVNFARREGRWNIS